MQKLCTNENNKEELLLYVSMLYRIKMGVCAYVCACVYGVRICGCSRVRVPVPVQAHIKWN